LASQQWRNFHHKHPWVRTNTRPRDEAATRRARWTTGSDQVECDGGSTATSARMLPLENPARSMRPTRASCKSHCKEQVGNNEIEPAVVSYSQRLVLRSDQTRLTPRLASFGQNAGWVRFAKMRGAPRPHAEERRSAMQAQVLSAADARCDASRSMRGLPPPHPSRRAHARPDLRQRFRTRAPQDEAAQGIPNSRFVAEPFSVIPISRCQTALLVPAAHFCARGLQLRFTNPESRGGRSAERRAGARRNTREARRIAARQALASLALRTVFARLFSQPRRKARMSHQKVSAKLPTEFRGGAA